MRRLSILTIIIIFSFGCNNQPNIEKVYVDSEDCRGCGGVGYTIKECRCVRDPEGIGKQNSHYDARDGEIKDCSQCVSYTGRAMYEDKGCEIGEIAVECSICSP